MSDPVTLSWPEYIASPMENVSEAFEAAKKNKNDLKAFLLQTPLVAISFATSVLSTFLAIVTTVPLALLALLTCVGCIDKCYFNDTLECLQEFAGLMLLSLVIGVFTLFYPVQFILNKCGCTSG